MENTACDNCVTIGELKMSNDRFISLLIFSYEKRSKDLRAFIIHKQRVTKK